MSVSLTNIITEKLHKDGSFKKKLVGHSKTILLQRLTFVQSKRDGQSHTKSLSKKYQTLNQMSNSRSTTSEKDKSSQSCQEGPNPKIVLYHPSKLTLRWRPQSKKGGGLNNSHNTCFLNSVLQALTHTPALNNYLSSREHGLSCPNRSNNCMICIMEDHVRNVSHKSVWTPWPIIKNLRAIARHFVHGKQEDAHEFLRYLIESMTKAALVNHTKLDAYSKNTTALHAIFGGYLRSQVKCSNCNHKSNTYDPMLDVALDIKKADRLQEALDYFTKAETLHGENAYSCERCKRKVSATKRFTIHTPPNVLTIQLKRFDMIKIYSKLNKQVYFPSVLDLNPYLSNKQSHPLKYDLYAVVVHAGSSAGYGHYYTYAKVHTGQWYLFNDNHVSLSSQEAALKQQAYILFYTRRVEHEQAISPRPASAVQSTSKQMLTGMPNQQKYLSGSSGSFIKVAKEASSISHSKELNTSREKVSFEFYTKKQPLDTPSQKIVMKIKNGKVVSNSVSPKSKQQSALSLAILSPQNKQTTTNGALLSPKSKQMTASAGLLSPKSKQTTNVSMLSPKSKHTTASVSSVKRQLVPYNTNSASSSSEDEASVKTKSKNGSVPPCSQVVPIPSPVACSKPCELPNSRLKPASAASDISHVNSNLKWTVYEPSGDTTPSTSVSSVNSTREWTVSEPKQQQQNRVVSVLTDSVCDSDHSYADLHDKTRSEASSSTSNGNGSLKRNGETNGKLPKRSIADLEPGELSDSPEPVSKVDKPTVTPNRSSEKRNGSDVVSRLESESLHTYGSHVRSWNGNSSTHDIEVKKDQTAEKRSWEDDYDEELDRGKTKKVKTRHEFENRNETNLFQKHQNYMNKLPQQSNRRYDDRNRYSYGADGDFSRGGKRGGFNGQHFGRGSFNRGNRSHRDNHNHGQAHSWNPNCQPRGHHRRGSGSWNQNQGNRFNSGHRRNFNPRYNNHNNRPFNERRYSS